MLSQVRRVMVCVKSHLSRDADFRLLSLSHVDDVDAIEKDVFKAAPEIRCGRQVRQILLYDTSDIQLGERDECTQSSSFTGKLNSHCKQTQK